MEVLRTLALGALIACSNESRTEQRTRPAPTQPVSTAAVEARPATPAGASVQGAEPCPATPATTVDLAAFMCAANAVPASSGFDFSGLVARLPPRFRKNVTLKHGARRPGERGHVQEPADDSPSASPHAPRVVMWDETTGFSITYDGTPPAAEAPPRVKRGAQRLGMLSVDPATAAFSLSVLGPNQPTVPEDDCRTCHGPDSRPIWPMYPDWPGFFGSDNDEVTADTAAQRDELAWLRAVREETAAKAGAGVASGTTRGRLDALFAPEIDGYLGDLFTALDRAAIRAYLATQVKPAKPKPAKPAPAANPTPPAKPLPTAKPVPATPTGDARPTAPPTPAPATATAVAKPTASTTPTLANAATGDDSVLRAWLGLELHATYPYRSNTEFALAEASRALFHRPNSRAGILYNRLQARRLMTRIRATAVYKAQPALVSLTVMDCGWPDAPMRAGGPSARVAAYESFATTAKTELAAREMPAPKPTDERILYPVLLASLGLAVRDVDIRLSHHSAEYARFDRGYAIPSIAKTVMDIGYIAYANPKATINGARLFWTSYFDGSASLDELLALAMLDDLAAKDPALAALYRPMSLTEKYGEVTARYAIDKPFFDDMDRLGRWLPLPYPDHLGAVHHRDSFARVRTGPEPEKFAFAVQYRAVCDHLRQTLRAP